MFQNSRWTPNKILSYDFQFTVSNKWDIWSWWFFYVFDIPNRGDRNGKSQTTLQLIFPWLFGLCLLLLFFFFFFFFRRTTDLTWRFNKGLGWNPFCLVNEVSEICTVRKTGDITGTMYNSYSHCWSEDKVDDDGSALCVALFVFCGVNCFDFLKVSLHVPRTGELRPQNESPTRWEHRA